MKTGQNRGRKPTERPSPKPGRPGGPSPTPLSMAAADKTPPSPPPGKPTGPPPFPLSQARSSLASPAPGRAGGTVEACGIIDWNGNGAALRNGAAGISRVARIGDGQIEVVFAFAGYEPLQSTVMVSSRDDGPCLIAWDTFKEDSVRVRTWEANGAPSPNGSFSIMVVQA